MKHYYATSSHKRKKRRYLVKFIILTIILAALYGWYHYSRYMYFLETPVDSSDSAGVTFVIKKGENLNEIAKNLFEKDLILDTDALKTHAKLSGNDRKIIAGRFILNRSMTIPQVVEEITNTDKSETIITIPEGSTVADIDNTLVSQGLINPGEFVTAVNDFDDWENYPFLDKESSAGLIHPLEGYLFPDTYFVDPLDFYSENLIQLMLNNFQTKLSDEFAKNHERSINEIIIMASIVEKEVRTTADIPVVAGILWKRLDSGWMLGADATLLYLKEDRTIDYGDLQDDSPYNTRLNAGLPPGPICNPGLKSIMGTLYPEESPYWFYLTTLDTGEVIYAESNEIHNQNKLKYLY